MNTIASRDEHGYDSPLTCSTCHEAVPACEHIVRQRHGEGRVRVRRAVLCETCAATLRTLTAIVDVSPVVDEDARLDNARNEHAISVERGQ